MFVLIFYFLSPIPITIARRYADNVEQSNALMEVCLFLTTGIVVSAYALPIVLAHAGRIIEWGACALIMAGNTVTFITILGYFIAFNSESDWSYSMW